MHPTAYEEVRKFTGRLPEHELSIADIGACNVNGCLRPLFNKPRWKYTGLDVAPG